MFGLLNLNKPRGISSRAAVDVVQRLVRSNKAGHAGTLDPLASGILVVCVGGATRLIEYVQQLPKRYLAEFQLGQESPTEDIEGEITLRPNDPQPTLAEIEAVLPQFTGQILQRPPAFSALKVAGKRAYDLARQGKEVTLQPRPIDVFSIVIQAYNYPTLTLDIRCGSGTYVRSLGRDLAEALGTAAVMSNLVRTEIGDFTLATAVSPDVLTTTNLAEHLLPADRAVQRLPRVTITSEEMIELGHGRSISLRGTETEEYAALSTTGKLVAVLLAKEGRWWPMRVFAKEE